MRKVVDAVRVVFGRERIEDLPSRHVDPFKIGLISWVFGREALPREDPSPVKRGPSGLRWLFAGEELPLDEPQAPSPAASPPFLATLFAREKLPADAGGGGGAPAKQE